MKQSRHILVDITHHSRHIVLIVHCYCRRITKGQLIRGQPEADKILTKGYSIWIYVKYLLVITGLITGLLTTMTKLFEKLGSTIQK